MRKFFGIIIIIFLFSSIGYGKTTLIDSGYVDKRFSVYEICTGGYKFVVVRAFSSKTGVTLSMVQVLDRNGKPETCVHTE